MAAANEEPERGQAPGARVALPATFLNSLHSPSNPRVALDGLGAKLGAGVRDSRALANHIRTVAAAHAQHSKLLLAALPAEPETYPAAGDDGASVGRALVSLRDAAAAEARAVHRLARELEERVLPPFEKWTAAHEDRIYELRADLDTYLSRYEGAVTSLERAKSAYEAKGQAADEAEDEARMTGSPSLQLAGQGKPRVPSSIQTSGLRHASAAQTHSPGAIMSAVEDSGEKDRTLPALPAEAEADDEENGRMGVAGLVKRSATITDRLRALASPTSPDVDGMARRVIKGKDKARVGEAPKMIEIAGVTNGAREWSSLFALAKNELPKRTLKLPLIATYNDAFTGADLIAWFSEHLIGLDDRESVVEFCRQLVEELAIIRLIGELGSRFAEKSFYIFQAFNLHEHYDEKSTYTTLPPTASPRLRPQSHNGSPVIDSSPLKRSNTLGAMISSAAANVTHLANQAREAATERLNEPKLHKAFREVESAETTYREAVERAEDARLALAERTAQYLPTVQRAEFDRLRATQACMRAFVGAQASVPAQIAEAASSASVAVDTVVPEQDLAQTIELYRTGPYRPIPHVFHDHYDAFESPGFGSDIVKWAQSKPPGSPDVPELLTAVLDRLKRSYADMPSDQERRLVFIYEIPVKLTHRLRAALIRGDFAALDAADGPVVASVLKSWLLELTPPLVPYTQYAEVRTLYASVGAGECSAESIRAVFEHIPRSSLIVLDAVVGHLAEVVADTQADEDDNTFRAKLGLALGRCLVRPKVETATTLDDRSPALLTADLIKHRAEILPPAIAHRARREDERFKPRRKRTALVDVRASRSRLGVEPNGNVSESDAATVLEDQLQRKGIASPPSTRSSAEPSVPAIATPSPPAPTSARSVSPAEFVDAPSPAATPIKLDDPPFEVPDEAPSVPTATPKVEDAPFEVPHEDEDDKPITVDGSLGRSGSSGLTRKTRLTGARGPRPLSTTGVASIAAKFNNPPPPR